MTNIMSILSIDTMKEDIKKELDFCIELREKQGGCEFNKQNVNNALQCQYSESYTVEKYLMDKN